MKQLIRLQKIQVVQLPSAKAIRNSCDHGWAKVKQYKHTCCRKTQYFSLNDFYILHITAEIVRPMAQLITKTQSSCTLSPEIFYPQFSCTKFCSAACSIYIYRGNGKKSHRSMVSTPPSHCCTFLSCILPHNPLQWPSISIHSNIGSDYLRYLNALWAAWHRPNESWRRAQQ